MSDGGTPAAEGGHIDATIPTTESGGAPNQVVNIPGFLHGNLPKDLSEVLDPEPACRGRT